LTVAGKKMTRLATVAYHKRNISIKIGRQENCVPRKRLTAAGIRMIHCAVISWLRRVVRKDCKVERSTQRVGPFG
jgi:hypothetical protein